MPTQTSNILKQVTGNWGGRYYETPDGERLDSVTTILQAINKPALVGWAAKTERALVMEAASALYVDLPNNGVQKMTKPTYITSLESRIGKMKAYTKEMEKATEIGKQVHAIIEWNIRKDLDQKVGPEPPLESNEATWAFMVYEEWRKAHSFTPQFIEQIVWSPAWQYAGTLDVLGDVDGIVTVLDWKSGKAIYDEALLQVTAYAKAIIEMGHAKPPIQGCIVRLPKVVTDPEPEIRIVSWEEIETLFPVFLQAQGVHQWSSAWMH